MDSVFIGMHLGKESNGFIAGRGTYNPWSDQETDKLRKNIINIFKSIDFKVEITTNFAEVEFLGVYLPTVQKTR